MEYGKEIAEILLDIQAVTLRPNEPFTWASGIRSPIYCDNRLILSYPEEREKVVDGFCSFIKAQYPETEAILGTATAGIPWAAMAAQKMKLPMGYVRASHKTHGKENAIEGRFKEGQKVVVIEDLISTGGSVKKVIESLKGAGLKSLAVCAIFSYQLPHSQALFEELGLPLFTLSNYSALADVALQKEYIQAEDLKKLKAFRQNPDTLDWMNA